MIFALIPAAGKSVRMGRCKLALLLGERTVLEHIIGALRGAGIEHVLAVIGPQVPELVPLAERAGAYALLLEEETADMRATVECGLSWLEQYFQPKDEDSWLLVPGDHPTLDAGVVRQLFTVWQAGSLPHGILVPTYQGKRGHPVLIGWNHVERIRQLPPGEGLNSYIRRHEGETREAAVSSAEVLRDLDTPEDYERLVASGERRGR